MYLGIDFGKKNIGLAISTSGYLAREYKTLSSLEEVAREIKKLDAKTIVIGLPLNSDASFSPQTRRVRRFARELKKCLKGRKLVFENEFLTSFEAEEQLRLQGIPLSRIRSKLDKRAAKIILEQYLSRKNASKSKS